MTRLAAPGGGGSASCPHPERPMAFGRRESAIPVELDRGQRLACRGFARPGSLGQLRGGDQSNRYIASHEHTLHEARNLHVPGRSSVGGRFPAFVAQQKVCCDPWGGYGVWCPRVSGCHSPSMTAISESLRLTFTFHFPPARVRTRKGSRVRRAPRHVENASHQHVSSADGGRGDYRSVPVNRGAVSGAVSTFTVKFVLGPQFPFASTDFT
jgi:hypothetical protein